ncbi:MAG: response regulator [Nitrososphaeraceae archaeon]|nr:response regulator [Nitrososphaeraceae archaeon]
MSLEISLAIDHYNTSDITSDMRSSNLKKPSASFSKNILVLDDELEIVSLIKHFLQRQGYRVFGFTDPMLAIEHFMLNSRNYSLVVCDVRMPAMNGFECVKKMREIVPSIKVILMSAFDINDPLYIGLSSSLKINDFIQKPFSLKELIFIIMKQLVKRAK